MPVSGKSRDLVDRIMTLEEQVRRLRTRTVRKRRIMTTHNFIVGGLVDATIYIPPARIYLPDPLEEETTGQTTEIHSVYGSFCRTGSVNVLLKLWRSGVESNVTGITPLQHGDRIRAQLTSGEGEDLTVWYVLIHDI